MANREPRKVEMALHYQNYIEVPPLQPKQMYGAACSSDGVTIDTWRETWIKHAQATYARFGSFSAHSVGKLHGKFSGRPAIIAGSGPSLGYNGELLAQRGDIPLISCLHNYQFFEDRGVKPDFYVTLDAGEVVVEEVFEGGKKSEAEYWESTKDKTLIAFIATHPKLFEKWQGKVYLYNAPVPDQKFMDTVDALEPFNVYISNGGNVLGASLYIAKAVLGCNPIAYVGADFAFGYNRKFHAWDSKYDAKLGHVLRTVDIYGNKVLTWQSYFNFKNWFDWVALQVPGIYINCTEGGTMGAYPEGNLMAIRQMRLDDFLEMYQMHDALKAVCENPTLNERKLLF